MCLPMVLTYTGPLSGLVMRQFVAVVRTGQHDVFGAELAALYEGRLPLPGWSVGMMRFYQRLQAQEEP